MIKVTTTSPQVIYFICYKILDLTKGERNRSLNFPTSPISLLSSFLFLFLLSFSPMASSSATPPAGSTPPLTTGEHPKTLAARSTVSIEAVVDVPVVPPSILGEAADPREGFVFPLMDPWYEIFLYFPASPLISLPS
jgi:hypothetical protein